jgi:hypothetical protein
MPFPKLIPAPLSYSAFFFLLNELFLLYISINQYIFKRYYIKIE